MDHALIVLGASAGGLEPLKQLVQLLPANLPAAVCIVQHIPADWSSYLPDILDSQGPLPCRHAYDGDEVVAGQIYVAAADAHMVIEDSHIHVIKGPKENGFRPSIDALFRTAARIYQTQTIGCVLSGMLDDGTAGLRAIAEYGGFTCVQDPHEAAYPEMPSSALRYVAVDYSGPIQQVGELIVDVARTRAAAAMPALVLNQSPQPVADSGLGPFSCPDCSGVLAEFYDGPLVRFRCKVGHVYSPISLLYGHYEMTERSLWTAISAIEERLQLAERLQTEALQLGDTLHARRFRKLAELAQLQRQRLQELINMQTSDDLA